MKTRISTISTLIILLFCYACQQKQNDTSCEGLEKKIDSLTTLYTDSKNSQIYKFHQILSKEKGTRIDTTLIKDYKGLIGKNESHTF